MTLVRATVLVLLLGGCAPLLSLTGCGHLSPGCGLLGPHLELTACSDQMTPTFPEAPHWQESRHWRCPGI